MSFGMEIMGIIKDMKATSDVNRRYLTSETVQPDPVLTPAWHQRLSTIREQIGQLDSVHYKPKITLVGTALRHPVSEAPDIAEETYVCMASLWM